MGKDENLQEIISFGENINIEFKSADVRPESLAREMVAFSNTYGGTVYIGIEDDGTVTGVDQNRKWDEWTANIARNSINPYISPNFSYIRYENKTIVRLDIQKGKNKPYQTLTDGKYWIRVASTVRMATQQELSRLFQAAGLIHFDISSVENTNFNSLNPKKLSAYFKDSYSIDWDGEENKKQILINSSILAELDGKLTATVGGLLTFSDFPERFLPQAVITIAVIKGKTITDEVVQKKEITGSLPEQIDNTVSFIRLYTPEPLIVKDSPRRENTLAVPVSVLRETIVNAVCHRDYSIQNRRIMIYIYSDRIEISSPGRIANTLNLEMIRYGNSAPRNVFLLKLLDNMHYIDGLGRGIPLIIREMGDRVEFSEDGEMFKVVLRF